MGTRRLVISITEARALTGIGFNPDYMAVVDQHGHTLRGQGNAVFPVFDLLDDADKHVTPMVQTRPPALIFIGGAVTLQYERENLCLPSLVSLSDSNYDLSIWRGEMQITTCINNVLVCFNILAHGRWNQPLQW